VIDLRSVLSCILLENDLNFCFVSIRIVRLDAPEIIEVRFAKH
jgi:hypothetical protein